MNEKSENSKSKKKNNSKEIQKPEELNSDISQEENYLGDPRINFSAELISQYIRKIHGREELETLYGFLDDVCIYLKVPKAKKEKFLEHLMKISMHDAEYLMDYLKNRNPTKEKKLE